MMYLFQYQYDNDDDGSPITDEGMVPAETDDEALSTARQILHGLARKNTLKWMYAVDHKVDVTK